MGVDAELEKEGAGEALDPTYSTVRDHINKEIEAIQHISSEGPIYEIHQSFESYAARNVAGRILIDGLFSCFLLILFLVLYPFIALGIKLSSPGPVLFKQLRTGKDGIQFVCYKFRTMQRINLKRIDGKPTVTEENDKRIFWFGKLLRRFSLDEIPQVINVLKGEMSLIGPRPYPVDECSFWNCTFDDFYYRYSTRPGITGLAQINGFRGGTLDEEHMKNRLDYDLEYTKNASLSIDFHILMRTFGKVLCPDQNAH